MSDDGIAMGLCLGLAGSIKLSPGSFRPFRNYRDHIPNIALIPIVKFIPVATRSTALELSVFLL